MPIIEPGLLIEGASRPHRVISAPPATAVEAVLTVTATGTSTAGTFLASIFGQTTSPLAWNATGATIAAALNALSSVGAGGFTGSGAAQGPFTLTAAGGNVSNKPLPLPTFDISLITGWTALVATTATAGVTPDGYGLPKGSSVVDTSTGIQYQQTGTTTAPVLTAV